MRKTYGWITALLSLLIAASCSSSSKQISGTSSQSDYPAGYTEISLDSLRDKVMGGFVAQVIGNINGLPHEFKYFGEPGNVTDYTPSLPDGARTDDDTDLEWVYISEMQRSGELLLAPESISRLWKEHINRGIWCANAYARQMMEIGIDPPFTGRVALNPWSDFNISGQFICESFGLICPGMPQAAETIGTHYTHVTIDGEPAQATQMFTAMIAAAFFQSDIDSLLDTGLAAIDPRSEHVKLVRDIRAWHVRYPDNWPATRELLRQKYARYGDHDGRETRDGNAYELNSGSTVAALLYGRGDLRETLRIAFNFGWDADNNAATSATIIGVIKGWDWIKSQGWEINDVYRNTTRDGMPEDETITSFGERVVDVAGDVILKYGGEEMKAKDGSTSGYRIKLQRPANVEPLPVPLDRYEQLDTELWPLALQWLDGPEESQARGAYVAIALGKAKQMNAADPRSWSGALEELRKHHELIKLLFDAPAPSGDSLRSLATEAGLTSP